MHVDTTHTSHCVRFQLLLFLRLFKKEEIKKKKKSAFSLIGPIIHRYNTNNGTSNRRSHFSLICGKRCPCLMRSHTVTLATQPVFFCFSRQCENTKKKQICVRIGLHKENQWQATRHEFPASSDCTNNNENKALYSSSCTINNTTT